MQRRIKMVRRILTLQNKIMDVLQSEMAHIESKEIPLLLKGRATNSLKSSRKGHEHHVR